jgi:hypothetical protein
MSATDPGTEKSKSKMLPLTDFFRFAGDEPVLLIKNKVLEQRIAFERQAIALAALAAFLAAPLQQRQGYQPAKSFAVSWVSFCFGNSSFQSFSV